MATMRQLVTKLIIATRAYEMRDVLTDEFEKQVVSDDYEEARETLMRHIARLHAIAKTE